MRIPVDPRGFSSFHLLQAETLLLPISVLASAHLDCYSYSDELLDPHQHLTDHTLTALCKDS